MRVYWSSRIDYNLLTICIIIRKLFSAYKHLKHLICINGTLTAGIYDESKIVNDRIKMWNYFAEINRLFWYSKKKVNNFSWEKVLWIALKILSGGKLQVKWFWYIACNGWQKVSKCKHFWPWFLLKWIMGWSSVGDTIVPAFFSAIVYVSPSWLSPWSSTEFRAGSHKELDGCRHLVYQKRLMAIDRELLYNFSLIEKLHAMGIECGFRLAFISTTL